MRRGLRVLGHPVHPMISDFPVVLFVLVLPLDLAALALGHPGLWAVSFWSSALGLAFTLPTAASGLIDYVALPPEAPASKTGLWHMGAMLSAVSCFGGALLVHGRTAIVTGGALWGALGLEGAGLLTLLIGGWLGGHLVFGHAVGVEAEPAAPIRAEPSKPSAS